MVGVGLSIPWFNRNRYRADIDRDRARASAARADADDYERDVRRDLFRVWTRIDAARREAMLYRDDILPRSELAVRTALAGWAAGRTMHLEVHEAHRMLVEARLMSSRALAEQHQMIAELVTCCGVAELDSLLMLGVEGTTGALPPPAQAPPASR
jgi:outer membrane protein TolC